MQSLWDKFLFNRIGLSVFTSRLIHGIFAFHVFCELNVTVTVMEDDNVWNSSLAIFRQDDVILLHCPST